MTFDDFVSSMNRLDDDVIWHIATMAAAIAGERAQQRGHDDIEKICIEFVEAMADKAGTHAMVYTLDA